MAWATDMLHISYRHDVLTLIQMAWAVHVYVDSKTSFIFDVYMLTRLTIVHMLQGIRTLAIHMHVGLGNTSRMSHPIKKNVPSNMYNVILLTAHRC